jgi:hypothetical protein
MGVSGEIGFWTPGMAPRFNDREYSDLLFAGFVGWLSLEIERVLI